MARVKGDQEKADNMLHQITRTRVQAILWPSHTPIIYPYLHSIPYTLMTVSCMTLRT